MLHLCLNGNKSKISRCPQIEEGDEIGSVVGQIDATDGDAGSDGVLLYELTFSTADEKAFKVTKDGYLVTNTVLDRETKSFYEFSITATDIGTPSLQSTADVSVEVADINDNRPVYPQNIYSASVEENSPQNTDVLQVIATDADKGTNSELSYGLSLSDSPFAQLFDIDNFTGSITIAGMFLLESTYAFRT